MRFELLEKGLRIAAAVSLLAPAALQAQVHGPERFPGYNPGRCAVATRMIDAINRVEFRDTSVATAERDTLFTATIESVRNCERVYAATAPSDAERLNAARVQRATRQYEAAIATEQQHAEAMAGRSIEERAWELHLMVRDNLAAQPARMDRARELLAELDAMGTPAASVRTVAHFTMLMAGQAHDDLALVRDQTQAITTAWQELDEAGRSFRLVWLLSAVMAQAEMEALVNGRDAALAVLQPLHGLIPSSQPRVHGRLRRLEQFYGLIGQPAQPLSAEFWYNTGETGAARPAPGRVSLILTIPRPCTESNGCLAMMDATRRFEREFGDDGLDITFRTQTFGFYADTAPADPVQEARYDSTYFLHDVEIPGALAVVETKYSFMADGRRINEPNANDLNYLRARTIVVDRSGTIRYVSENWVPALERPLHVLLEQLVREEPRAGGNGASGSSGGGGP